VLRGSTGATWRATLGAMGGPTRRLRAACLSGIVLVAAACLPEGSFDSATLERRTDGLDVMVRGWARDPDTKDSIDIRVMVNGALRRTARADRPRPDVQRTVDGAGPNHGYEVSLRLTPGRHRICIVGVNVLEGDADPELGCRRVVVPGAGALPVRVIGSSVIAQTMVETATVLEQRGYQPQVHSRLSMGLDSTWTHGQIDNAVGTPIVVIATANNDNMVNAQRAAAVGEPRALDEYRLRIALTHLVLEGSCVVWVNARDVTNPIYLPSFAPRTNLALATGAHENVIVDWATISRPRGLDWFVSDLLHVDELRNLSTGAVIVPGPRRQAGADAHARAIAEGVDICARRFP
jgi:hypothetical protein